MTDKEIMDLLKKHLKIAIGFEGIHTPAFDCAMIKLEELNPEQKAEIENWLKN